MKKSVVIYVVLTVLLLLSVCGYIFWLRPNIEAVLQGAGPEWLHDLAFGLYPRLSAEINRLPAEFFIDKADQVLLRIALVSISTGVFIAFLSHKAAFKKRVNKFWKRKIAPAQYDGLRIAFAIAILLCCYDWYSYLLLYSKADPFYEPISFLGLLDIPFPRSEFILIYCIALISFLLLIAFNIRPRFFAIYAAVLFVVLQGFMNSFEKLDHHFAPVTYAIMLFPFLVSEVKLALRRGEEIFPAWPLQLIKISIVGVYFLSGLEKLLISGTDWIFSDSFCQYLSMKGQPFGIWVAQYPLLCMILPAFALLFQLLFPLVLFYPRTRWFFLPAGVLFHFGVWLMLGIGAPVHTWVYAYIFFLDMGWLGKAIPHFMKVRVANAQQ